VIHADFAFQIQRLEAEILSVVVDIGPKPERKGRERQLTWLGIKYSLFRGGQVFEFRLQRAEILPLGWIQMINAMREFTEYL
jgi:hypothetical protein